MPVWRAFKTNSLWRQDGLCSPKCMDWSLKHNADHSPPHRVAVGLFGTGRTCTDFQSFPGSNSVFVNCRLYPRTGATNHCPHDLSRPRFLSGLMHGSSSPQSSSSQKHTLPIPGITRGLGCFPFPWNFVSDFQTVTISFLTHFSTYSHVCPFLTRAFSCSLAPRTATSILAVWLPFLQMSLTSCGLR